MRALILAADRVEDCEMLYPLYRLREEGIDSDVAAPEAAGVAAQARQVMPSTWKVRVTLAAAASVGSPDSETASGDWLATARTSAGL